MNECKPLAVGMYVGWSWNAGDAAAVFDATVAGLPSLSAGAAAFVPDVPREFWAGAYTRLHLSST